jgi:predicted dehydrogenase
MRKLVVNQGKFGAVNWGMYFAYITDYMKKIAFLLLGCLVSTLIYSQPGLTPSPEFRVGIAGLVHTHVHGILGRKKADNIRIVGIAEPNRKLAEAYSKQYGFSMDMVYNTLEEMVTKTRPQGVLAFNTIFDHLKTVEYCAPRGIHVMVEKPLAVSHTHAKRMLSLAKKHNIFLLTNYETTWYGSNKKAYELVNEKQSVGPVRKIVFHTGHQGPIEIGCNPEFLEWLTDPVLNGGGAITDFGCYGANISTWMMKGEKPLSVTAITQQLKPDMYPKVDDEATILLTYPSSQVIIQASWNWPFSRKDMEVYGRDGFVFCTDHEEMVLKPSGEKSRSNYRAPGLEPGVNDPFIYFANVVNGSIKMAPYDLSAPANNEIVMQILEAAKHSAKTNTTVTWKKFFKDQVIHN